MNSTALEKTKIGGGYRIPMRVTHFRMYGLTDYYICPRCGITLEREFMAYCDRCGQRLSWKQYKKVVVMK